MKKPIVKNNLFVISLGGSLINPGEIDSKFLKSFRQLILSQTKKGARFIISPGGGKTSRRYQQALKEITPISNDDLDWIGIYANNFHAKFLRLIFKQSSHSRIAEDPNKKISFNEKILISAGGWKPGRSSDDTSVRLAKTYGALTVINLSNIDFVYNKDPRKFRNAQKIENISWADFLKITGSKWDPGANVPFDPTAAKFAKTNKIKVIITNGKNLENLKALLEKRNFLGTKIS